MAARYRFALAANTFLFSSGTRSFDMSGSDPVQ